MRKFYKFFSYTNDTLLLIFSNKTFFLEGSFKGIKIKLDSTNNFNIVSIQAYSAALLASSN